MKKSATFPQIHLSNVEITREYFLCINTIQEKDIPYKKNLKRQDM